MLIIGKTSCLFVIGFFHFNQNQFKRYFVGPKIFRYRVRYSFNLNGLIRNAEFVWIIIFHLKVSLPRGESVFSGTEFMKVEGFGKNWKLNWKYWHVMMNSVWLSLFGLRSLLQMQTFRCANRKNITLMVLLKMKLRELWNFSSKN